MNLTSKNSGQAHVQAPRRPRNTIDRRRSLSVPLAGAPGLRVGTDLSTDRPTGEATAVKWSVARGAGVKGTVQWYLVSTCTPGAQETSADFSRFMLEFLLALAAPLQDGQLQDEQLEPSVVNVEHQRLSLGQINNLYRNGRPSNDVHLAGLFVHQHDDAQVRPPATPNPTRLHQSNCFPPKHGKEGSWEVMGGLPDP